MLYDCLLLTALWGCGHVHKQIKSNLLKLVVHLLKTASHPLLAVLVFCMGVALRAEG